MFKFDNLKDETAWGNLQSTMPALADVVFDDSGNAQISADVLVNGVGGAFRAVVAEKQVNRAQARDAQTELAGLRTSGFVLDAAGLTELEGLRSQRATFDAQDAGDNVTREYHDTTLETARTSLTQQHTVAQEKWDAEDKFLRGQIEHLTATTALTQAVLAAGARPADQVVKLLQGFVQSRVIGENEDRHYEAVVVDAHQQPRENPTSGKPFSMTELVSEFLKQDGAHFVAFDHKNQSGPGTRSRQTGGHAAPGGQLTQVKERREELLALTDHTPQMAAEMAQIEDRIFTAQQNA